MKFLPAIQLGARLGLALALAGQLLAAPVPTAWEVARVTRVVDGDTYEVLTGGQVLRVRLLGVDAPEHDQLLGRRPPTRRRPCYAGDWCNCNATGRTCTAARWGS